MKQTIIETDRLCLRAITQSDYPSLCAILQDPEVMYAYEHAFSESEVRAWLDNQLRRYCDDGFGLWAVIDKWQGRMIGQCGITMQKLPTADVPEIGYLFHRTSWHLGYATEAAAACRDYAFNTLDFGQIYSIIRDANIASQRVALRLGMRQCDSFIKHYYGIDMPHLVFVAERESGR